MIHGSSGLEQRRMKERREEKLRQGLNTAFIDGNVVSEAGYRPQFLLNNYHEGRKVLSAIEEELSNCDRFDISVAFVTMGGITPLLERFQELEARGIPGRILTTDYLTFSEPGALDKLAGLNNIELRMYRSDEERGFHTKGYIFEKDNLYRIIIGSSNLTQKALTVNQEWNTRIVSTEEGEMAERITREFTALWESDSAFPYELVAEEYRLRFETIRKQREIAARREIPSLSAYRLEPNDMQVAFIENLKETVARGESKGLLISATGTGKTYASAFGIRDALMPKKKILFIVHRREILNQAKSSYENVFGDSRKMAMLSGRDKDFESIDQADCIFAMVNMMSRDEILRRFKRDEFSVICFDEVHHGTAPSYQRVMNYFTPDFVLGMTATPDRTDEGDVYALFDHNIIYEIRLQQALENDLLCPFHYFGIRDIAFGDQAAAGDLISRMEKGDMSVFNLLTRDERVEYIIKQADYYGYCGDRVKGLMFCSTVDEAKALSAKLNERGLKTLALTGNNTSEERIDAIERLTDDRRTDRLDYILSVDIFNEGVDIPQINQVIMLRPTESAIVFVQQLGRGLRKSRGKEYVVILDFIGNYDTNFLIPIALSGDRTYNKDNMRKHVREGSSVIPGSSTIHFDEVSKSKIYAAIDKAKTKGRFLKENYEKLRKKLGRVPTSLEFYKYGEIDPILFVEYRKASYYEYVRSVDPDAEVPLFTEEQRRFLDFISTQLVNGKRPHELTMLQLLLEHHRVDFSSMADRLLYYDIGLRGSDYQSTVNFLMKNFLNTQTDRARYDQLTILREQFGEAFVSDILSGSSDGEFIEAVRDVLDTGLMRYRDYYLNADEDNLVLYQKYSRRDVCRILNWEKDDSSTVYGYRIKHGTCPIFVTYEKKEDISETTKYEDRFIDDDRQVFSWMTRSRVTETSPEAQEIIRWKENGLKLYLFIKKSDGEGSDFYYMGRVEPIDYQQTEIRDKSGKAWPIMNFKLRLEHEVRNDIYEYLTR